MTNYHINSYGNPKEASHAFEETTRDDMVHAGSHYSKAEPIGQTYKAVLAALDKGMTISQFASWEDNAITNRVVGISHKGIPLLNTLLQDAHNNTVMRRREVWEANHGGLRHPDNKIQAG